MKKNDTNRLANRGGALLKEEKIRKGISKELPKVKIVYKIIKYLLTLLSMSYRDLLWFLDELFDSFYWLNIIEK